jgi:hypothetical protein
MTQTETLEVSPRVESKGLHQDFGTVLRRHEIGGRALYATLSLEKAIEIDPTADDGEVIVRGEE